MKLYSYVVEHDTGREPNPYSGVCTLCGCKRRKPGGKRRNIVELVEERDWIVGTGGADTQRSAGNGKVVYAMRVDKKLALPREEEDGGPRVTRKRGRNTPQGNKLSANDPGTCCRYVLISRHFYYFGAKAVRIPRRFSDLEKQGRGFKKNFDSAYVSSFVEWLKKNHKPGKHGEPRMKSTDKPRGSKRCR